MPVAPIRFEPDRALALVLYVANRLRYPTLHSVSKVLYFADRDHLSRYGSLLSGDTYVAMRHGPAPSAIHNLMKAAAGRQETMIPPVFYRLFRESLGVENEHRVTPLRHADESQLSAAQRECLDNSIRQNGRLSFVRLTAKSYDAAWKSADANDIMDVKAIARTLPNARDVLAALSE